MALAVVDEYLDPDRVDMASYRVVEEHLDGYTTEVAGSLEEGFIFTNAHERITCSFTVRKVWASEGDTLSSWVLPRMSPSLAHIDACRD